jgi:hypothetical protein
MLWMRAVKGGVYVSPELVDSRIHHSENLQEFSRKLQAFSKFFALAGATLSSSLIDRMDRCYFKATDNSLNTLEGERL